MLTDHIHEDSAARKICEARDTSTALFKAALRDRIPIAGPLDGVTVALYRGLRDQRPRSDVVPFKKVTPSPRPAPPPAYPLRPAASIADVYAKLSRSLDRKRRPAGLGDLLLAKLRTGGAR